MIRTYLDWLAGLPWSLRSEDKLDLEHAREVLDEDHYGLEKVKERILEYLAVRKLKPESKGPILCFVGPPGVGKTSLGRSIARALGRKFVRISLGGVRDEAEIRGHRRTYVGALPGRIIQGLQQAGTRNPVFMLDEIDKLGADFRGDPSSALLEVLDPEQNSTFRDHYLDVPFDLSRGDVHRHGEPARPDPAGVPRPHGGASGCPATPRRRSSRSPAATWSPSSCASTGSADASWRSPTPRCAASSATTRARRACGTSSARSAAVCRKVARQVAEGDDGAELGDAAAGRETCSAPPATSARSCSSRDRVGRRHRPGLDGGRRRRAVHRGLAVAGKGKLMLTGQLGDVMKESAQAALSFARSRAGAELGADFFADHDVHIHVPAGAIPKDGPSAGITIATALVSVLTGRRSIGGWR